MEKKYIIGGLAIVGAIALFAYLRPKPRRNSEGFFGASGGMGSGNSSKKSYGVRCRRPNGTYYSTQAGQDYCTYSSDTIVSYGN